LLLLVTVRQAAAKSTRAMDAAAMTSVADCDSGRSHNTIAAMVISGVVEVLGGHPPARGSQRSLAGSAYTPTDSRDPQALPSRPTAAGPER
jgi:hypothetical protein